MEMGSHGSFCPEDDILSCPDTSRRLAWMSRTIALPESWTSNVTEGHVAGES
jgi:hypothetical protein